MERRPFVQLVLRRNDTADSEGEADAVNVNKGVSMRTQAAHST